MIEKTAEYIQTQDDQEIFSILPEPSKTEGLVKTAEYASEVAQFLDSLDREPGFVYALANALTAGEYYGPNRNGDFFPEEALKKYHHTFVDHGHVYKHHVNKDPKKSMGKVIYSYYNPHMKRVETVIKLQESHPDVCKLMTNMKKGMNIKLSMGCKVPYDVCSITGKKARTRKEYSDYLRNKMNKILDDGRRVYAINTKPRFFDLSIVTIPADPLAAIMAPIGFGKMAEDASGPGATAQVDNEATMEKAANLMSDKKHASIKKEINAGEIDAIEEDPKRIILDSQENFTDEQIEKLSQYPLNETLSTFCALRILPKREDFQKLALYTTGNRKLAKLLEEKGFVFETSPKDAPEINNIGPDYVNEKVANEIKPDISKFSLTKPAIINRIIEKSANIKSKGVELYPNRQEIEQSFINSLLFDDEPRPAGSGVKNAIPLMTSVGALYAGYAKIFGNSANVSNFTKFIAKNPWIAPVAGLGMGIAIENKQKEALEPVNEEIFNIKHASKASPFEKTLGTFLLAAPTSYYMAAKNEAKARKGQPLSDAEDFVRRNPLLTAVGATGFIRGVSKGIGHSIDDAKSSLKAKKVKKKKSSGYFNAEVPKTAGIDNLNPETINIIYKELIS